MSLRVSSD